MRQQLLSILALTVVAIIGYSCAEKSFEEKTAHYTIVEEIGEGKFRVMIDNKWGVVDSLGNETVEPQYKYIWGYANGYAPIQSYSGYGFLNKSGVEAVAPYNYRIYDFLPSGLAVVQQKEYGKWGMIDGTGKYVVEAKFRGITPFNNGFATMSYGTFGRGVNNVRHGIINDKGEIVVSCKYIQLGTFNDGLVPVKYEEWGEFAYLNTSGQEVIAEQFDDAKDFEGPVARVKKDLSWYLINRQGKIISQAMKSIGEFNDGFATITTRYRGKNAPTSGYMDKEGNTIIKYESVKNFNNGCAVVSVIDQLNKLGLDYNHTYKWMLINTKFEPITSEKFDSADEFFNGVCRVYNKRQGYGFVNTKGEMIVPCKYDKAEIVDGVIRCTLMGDIFLFDFNGKAI